MRAGVSSPLARSRRLTPLFPFPPLDWSNHGICGRGVLLDLVHYYTADGNALPYDPWTSHPISVAELEACAKKQGVTFRRADVLLVRVGFIQKYYAAHNDAKAALRGGSEVERLCVVFPPLPLFFFAFWCSEMPWTLMFVVCFKTVLVSSRART